MAEVSSSGKDGQSDDGYFTIPDADSQRGRQAVAVVHGGGLPCEDAMVSHKLNRRTSLGMSLLL